MKTVIFCGFRPFGIYKANLTEIVSYDVSNEVISGFNVRSVLFDACIARFNLGKSLLEIASTLKATAIISMGMASEKRGLCVEGTAVNRIYNERYVSPDLNNTPINRLRLYNEKLELDLEPWDVHVFQKTCKAQDIPVMETSHDAGNFCCNQLMYQFRLLQLRAETKIPFIFIHVPCCKEAIPDPNEFAKAGKITMTADQVVRGLVLLLENASI